MSVSGVAGSDVLSAAFNAPEVPGFDVLDPSNSSKSSNASTSSSASPSSTVNPYQQAYDNTETWSAGYLMSSVENGAPSTLPEFAGGGTAGAFAQLNQTLAALKPLVALNAAAGVGTNIDTVA